MQCSGAVRRVSVRTAVRRVRSVCVCASTAGYPLSECESTQPASPAAANPPATKGGEGTGAGGSGGRGRGRGRSRVRRGRGSGRGQGAGAGAGARGRRGGGRRGGGRG